MEGCGILGTVRDDRSKPQHCISDISQGGGGSPYPTYLVCRQILRDGGTISIVDPTSLKDDDIVVRGCALSSNDVLQYYAGD